MSINVSIVGIDVWAIKIALARNKMRTSDLCEKTGISQSNLSSMIRRGRMRSTTAGRIAEALGVDVETIIKKEE